MENITGFHKVTATVKGKPVEKLISNYDKTIIITSTTSPADVKKAIALSNQKKSQGFTSENIGYGVSTLQSPTNQWMLQADTLKYKVPETSKGVPQKDTSTGIGKNTLVNGELVFVRYGDNMTKMIKMATGAPYNYVNVDESEAIPYHTYVLKNQNLYTSGKGQELIAWAKGIEDNVKSAFDGDDNFEGDDNFSSNEKLDLGFDGNEMVDLSVIGSDNSNFTSNEKLVYVVPVGTSGSTENVSEKNKYKVRAIKDIEFQKLKNDSIRKTLKAGDTAIVKIVKNSKGDIIAYIYEGNGKTVDSQPLYVRRWYHTFKGELGAGTIQDLLKNYFKVMLRFGGEHFPVDAEDMDSTMDVDGIQNLDDSVVGKFASVRRIGKPRKHSFSGGDIGTMQGAYVEFSGGAMDDMYGAYTNVSGNGDTDLGTAANTTLDLSFSGNEGLDLSFTGKKSNFSLQNGSSNEDIDLNCNGEQSDFASNENIDLGFDGQKTHKKYKIKAIKNTRIWMRDNKGHLKVATPVIKGDTFNAFHKVDKEYHSITGSNKTASFYALGMKRFIPAVNVEELSSFSSGKTVFTKDGVEVEKGNNKYKGHIFYDEKGGKYECLGYFPKLDDCVYNNLQTNKKVVGCMDGFYFNNPLEKKSTGSKTVFTKDGVEVEKRSDKYKGHIFFDADGGKYKCLGYFPKLDDCKYLNMQTGKEVVGCMDGFYFNNPLETKTSNFNGNEKLDLSFDGSGAINNIDLSFIGSEEQSNTIGSWFKKTFSKKSKVVSPADAQKLADKNKVVYTEAEMKQLYASSGTKTSFADWAKSDNAKAFLGTLKTMGSAWLEKLSQTNAPNSPATDASDTSSNDKTSGGGSTSGTTIAGLHPITFGIIIVVASIGIIGGLIIYSKHKAKVSVAV